MSAALHPVDPNPIAPPHGSRASEAPDSIRVQPCTVEQMARQAGVSRRLMFLAIKAHRGGCDELRRAMVDGTVTANLGVVLVDLFPTHDDQRTVLREFRTLPPRQWLDFARRVAALMAKGSCDA
jgi:hypothetical protein